MCIPVARGTTDDSPAPEWGRRIAASVKAWRRIRGMTQEQLAELAGMDRPRITKIEAGHSVPRTKTLRRLATALGVSVGEIVDGPPGTEAKDTTTSNAVVEGSAEFDEIVRNVVRGVLSNSRLVERFRDAAAEMRRDSEQLSRQESLEPSAFIEGDYDFPQPYRRGPVDVGTSAAGSPIDADRDEADVLNPIRRDVASGRYVVVRVKGDSMLPRLKDGDLVVVDTLDKEIGPRRVMAVYIYGEGSMLGVVHRVGGQLIVTKANTDYPPRILGEPETFLIQGRVTKRLEEDFEG